MTGLAVGHVRDGARVNDVNVRRFFDRDQLKSGVHKLPGQPVGVCLVELAAVGFRLLRWVRWRHMIPWTTWPRGGQHARSAIIDAPRDPVKAEIRPDFDGIDRNAATSPARRVSDFVPRSGGGTSALTGCRWNMC